MKNINLFDYPKYLNKIFDKLELNGIKPIIIGGYIRDFLLHKESKDIDIELYGINSFSKLENLLQEFGSVNSVGKSFGVCKLTLESIEIDFTLPRRDNKIASGHSGFEITIDETLDFKTASSRRDFTMNTIGYNTKTKKILDPFNGINDIKNKSICAVDLEKFAQDPLRVFRAVAFASRFKFTLEKNLLVLCKKMCEENLLLELSQERIYGELKKLLLQSTQPSIGFLLLREMNALKYLQPLDNLKLSDFSSLLDTLNRMKSIATFDNRTNMVLLLAVLCYKFSEKETKIFISNLTNKNKLADSIYSLVREKFNVSYTQSELLILATRVNIELFLLYSQALHPEIDEEVFFNLKKRATALYILNKPQEALLKGRDLLAKGIQPSKEYSIILNIAYKKQLSLEIQSYEEALLWLDKYLLT